MHAQIVKEGSRLAQAKCSLCPRPVLPGQSVLYKDMKNTAYLEDRIVFHLDCMERRCASAPRGIPAGDHRAAAERIRRAVADDTTDLYGRPAA